jgi:hypothetical protein
MKTLTALSIRNFDEISSSGVVPEPIAVREMVQSIRMIGLRLKLSGDGCSAVMEISVWSGLSE